QDEAAKSQPQIDPSGHEDGQLQAAAVEEEHQHQAARQGGQDGGSHAPGPGCTAKPLRIRPALPLPVTPSTPPLAKKGDSDWVSPESSSTGRIRPANPQRRPRTARSARVTSAAPVSVPAIPKRPPPRRSRADPMLSRSSGKGARVGSAPA